jgi:hypothetical protein
VDARERFQLYLLSKMTASELVDGALGRLGRSRAEMVVTAAVLAANHGFDEVSHPADAYGELLGRPEAERALTHGETGDEFSGSIQRLYALPLWPAVRFAVNRHPHGYAWGVGFEQHMATPDADAVTLAESVRPWEFASEPLLARASGVELIDEWSDSLEALLEFRANGRAATWHARFDLRLLQSWLPAHAGGRIS